MFMPCGPCCCNYADRFTRADGAVGSDWTVDSGTWAIASNKLRCSTSTGLIIWNADNSRSDGIQSANVRLLSLPAGRVVRLILGHAGPDDYIAVELTNANAGTGANGLVALVVRVGGSETTYYGEYFTSQLTNVWLWACLRPAPDLSYVEFIGALSFGTDPDHTNTSFDIYRTSLPYLGGTKAAIAAMSGSGNVDFDDFSFPYAISIPVSDITCVNTPLRPCGGGAAGSASWAAPEATFTTTANGNTVAIAKRPHNRNEARYRATLSANVVSPSAVVTTNEIYTDWQDATNHHYAKLSVSAPSSGGGFAQRTVTLEAFKDGASLGSTSDVVSYVSITGFNTVMDWCMADSSHVVTATFSGIGAPANPTLTLSFTSTPHTDPSNTSPGGWMGNRGAVYSLSSVKGVRNVSSPYDGGTCDNC